MPMEAGSGTHGVYRSESGRAAVENYYRRALDEYRAVPLTRRTMATDFGKTQVFACGDPARPPLILLHGSMANSAAFLGMSLGSFYALSFAVASPERVSALSMLSTAGIAPQRKDFMLKALFCMLIGAPGKKLLNRLIYYKAEVPPQIHEFQALVSANFNPVTGAIPILDDATLKRLVMPVQYFGGDHDALLDTARTVRRLAALCPEAEIHLVPDTGHAILDQWPAIKAFLASCRSPGRQLPPSCPCQ